MPETATLVTGASAGIGAAIVERLLQDGRTVVTLQRRASARRHAKLHHIACDLTDASATANAGAEAARRFAIEALVHNAGGGEPQELGQIELETFQGMAALHMQAAMQLAQAVAPGMRERRFGRIVTIGSRAMLGKQGRTAYASTKAGLLAMTRVWAMELGPDGITANMVAPGPIRTELFERHNPIDSPRVKRMVESIPARRIGEPDEVARAVEFFLSPKSGFITGQVLYVCGGLSVGSVTI